MVAAHRTTNKIVIFPNFKDEVKMFQIFPFNSIRFIAFKRSTLSQRSLADKTSSTVATKNMNKTFQSTDEIIFETKSFLGTVYGRGFLFRKVVIFRSFIYSLFIKISKTSRNEKRNSVSIGIKL